MAGLSDVLSNKEVTTTALPGWYDTAQQGIVNAATTAATPGAAQNFATSTFAPGTTNPFTSAAGTLDKIASGAANPWNVATDASGKQTVTPNVSTPLGGLFSAQEGLLNRIMPDITAPAEASGVSSGGFGGSQQRYGVQRAKSAALADLFQKQMTEALQAQQVGTTAATNEATVTGQGVKSALDTAGFPMTNLSNAANVINAAKPGVTTTKNVELAPLNQIAALLSGVGGGTNLIDSLLGAPQRGTAAVGQPGQPGYVPASADWKAAVPGVIAGGGELFNKLKGALSSLTESSKGTDISKWGTVDSSASASDPTTGLDLPQGTYSKDYAFTADGKGGWDPVDGSKASVDASGTPATPAGDTAAPLGNLVIAADSPNNQYPDNPNDTPTDVTQLV